MSKASSGLRPYAWEKAAFLEDANEDSHLTDAAFRVLQKICTAFNRKEGYAECARNFIVDRVPVSVKTVQRARKVLLSEKRVFIIREPIGRASTRFGVNWYFRGADKVRAANDGKPIMDIRLQPIEGTFKTDHGGTLMSKLDSVEGTYVSPEMDTNVSPTPRRGDTMSLKPIISPQGEYNGAGGDAGAMPSRAAPRTPGTVFELIVRNIRAEEIDGNWRVICEFADDEGGEYEDWFWAEHQVPALQNAGQKRIQALMLALDINEFEDLEQYDGRRLDARYVDGEIEYVSSEVRRRMAG